MQQPDDYNICFSNHVCLKNIRDNKFLCAQASDGKVSSSGYHPTISYAGCNLTQEFTIVNSQNKDYCGLITFGSSIQLVDNTGRYLVFDASEEVKLEHIESAANTKLTKWTIHDPANSGVRRPITVYDEITLRTPFGELVVDAAGVAFANGQGFTPESTWKIMKANVPYMPDWVFTRPALNHNDLVLFKSIGSESGPKHLLSLKRKNLLEEPKLLRTFPVDQQEHLLLEDLLFVLTSIEGTYIKRKQVISEGTRNFVVEPHLEVPSCDESLLYLVNKILPYCDQHDHILSFVNLHSHYEYGLVSHALCEAITALLKEFSLRLTQIDHEHSRSELTLQKLWFYLQPCLRTLETLHSFVQEADQQKGGALLNTIYKSMVSASDQHHKKLYKFLIEKAAVPYLEMLRMWVHLGVIDDPYEEFMIKERKELSKENLHRDYNDSYWDHRFEFREAQTPLFLPKLAAKVLCTGKYLNVVRECGQAIECPFAQELDHKRNPKLVSSIGNHREFLEPIGHAFSWASSTLLSLIMEKEQLIARLKSLKHYFFLDLGDFFVHFLDSAEEELSKPIKYVSKEKLESLLDLSLRTSSANSDPFKDDVTCELQSYTLLEQLYALHNISGSAPRADDIHPIFTSAQRFKGIETFVIDYKVQWPLTLIISRKALAKYQLIFRHLFFCKYVERQLCNTWLLHQSTKELDLRAAFSSSYCLIQRMLHFVKNYVYYMAVEVLEEQWHHLSEGLKTVKTIDEIMKLHNTFLDDCLKECLLMDQELLMVINKIIWICSYFAEMIQNHTKSMELDDSLISQASFDLKKGAAYERKEKIERKTSATMKVLAKHKYKYIIEEYTSRFDKHLLNFLTLIHRDRGNSDNHLINLIIRLDYNGYYSEFWMAQDNP